MINYVHQSIPALNKKCLTPALRMVVCSIRITEVEMRAVKESCEASKWKEVYLIHEPMAQQLVLVSILCNQKVIRLLILVVVQLKLPLLL